MCLPPAGRRARSRARAGEQADAAAVHERLVAAHLDAVRAELATWEKVARDTRLADLAG